MIIALIFGALIGFVLALPPGPVAVAAVKQGLFNGRKPGTYMAIGTGLMDFVYCAVAMLATSAAVEAVNDFSSDYPFVMLAFQISIVLVFVILGIINLRSNNNGKISISNISNGEIQSNSKVIENLKTKGPFLLGIGIALTNMANPTFLPSLAWISMQIHQFRLIDNTIVSNLFFSVGFGVGNFLWLYILISFVIRFKDKLSDQMITRIRRFAGVTFIGFGTFLGYRILTLTHWPDVIRLLFAF